MLVLTRMPGESIVIRAGEARIEVKVLQVRGDNVRLGVEAPQDVAVNRAEIDAAKLGFPEGPRGDHRKGA